MERPPGRPPVSGLGGASVLGRSSLRPKQTSSSASPSPAASSAPAPRQTAPNPLLPLPIHWDEESLDSDAGSSSDESYKPRGRRRPPDGNESYQESSSGSDDDDIGSLSGEVSENGQGSVSGYDEEDGDEQADQDAMSGSDIEEVSGDDEDEIRRRDQMLFGEDGDEPQFHEPIEAVRRKREIEQLYEGLYDNEQTTHARRMRRAEIQQRAVDPETGKHLPPQSNGERNFRRLMQTPIDDEERDEQVNLDRGLHVAVPVPPPKQRLIDRVMPRAERTTCFGCDARIQTKAQPKYQSLKQFVEYLQQNIGLPPHILSIHLAQLYTEIREEHNQGVDKHNAKKTLEEREELKLPSWPEDAIYEHIVDHLAVQPGMFVRKNFDRLEQMNDILMNQAIFRIDPRDPSRYIIHEKSADRLTKNILLQQKLLTTPIRSMNFYEAGLGMENGPPTLNIGSFASNLKGSKKLLN